MKRSNRTIIYTTSDFSMILSGDSSHGDAALNLLWNTFAADTRLLAFLEPLSSNDGPEMEFGPGFPGIVPVVIMPAQIEEAWMGWSARPGLSMPSN